MSGVFAGAIVNNEPARSYPETVTIPAGDTVREDAVLNIP